MVGLFAAALGIVVALVADIVAARRGAARVLAYGVGLLSGFAATLAAGLAAAPAEALATLGLAALAYGAWWFILLNLVQALESSLRVRLLGEIRAAGGRIRRDVLEARYSDAVLLRLRLDRLLSHGAVVERDGRLFLASRGLMLIAAFFGLLKKLLMGRRSEFEAL